VREIATFILDTFSGQKLNLSVPVPDQIAVEHIASALSKIGRFGAQAGHFYSVAQHAMLISDDLVIRAGRPELQALLAEAGVLIHDAGEGIRQALAAEGKDVTALEPLPRIQGLLAPEEAEQAFVAAHAAAS
jgi:hypothetical protein